MKILQIGKFYPIIGGVEKVMRDLTEGISARSIRCDMLCALLPDSEIEQIDKKRARHIGRNLIIELNNNGKIICVPAIKKVKATMLSPAMLSYLKRHCKEYDIIHIHHPDPMAALALRLSGYKGKVILHYHSDILSQKKLLKLYKPLQSWLLKRADKIVGTTPVYIKESPFLKNYQQKCTYVPIGIEPVVYSEEEAEKIRNKFGNKKIILSIGRLVPYKGYEYLIEAAKHLTDEYYLVIGGGGPLKDELQAKIEQLGLENKVTLAGYIDYKDLPAYFGACHIFVLSSVMKTEAFGIVQIEAMSCSKPIVATKIEGSGVSWVNKEGESGLNVPPMIAESLTNAIFAVDKEYDKYSVGAKERFNSVFTYSQMIDNILKIYENKTL